MNMSEKKKCRKIIHSAGAAAAAIGAGLAQLPCSDNAVLKPLQITMTIALGKVFGIRLSRAAAESMLLAGLATDIGRGVSQALVGWIPGVGNIVNATTAASLTEALGWYIAKDFSEEAEVRRLEAE